MAFEKIVQDSGTHPDVRRCINIALGGSSASSLAKSIKKLPLAETVVLLVQELAGEHTGTKHNGQTDGEDEEDARDGNKKEEAIFASTEESFLSSQEDMPDLTFDGEEENGSEKATEKTTTEELVQNPFTVPVQCAFFRQGTCKQGDGCKFVHGPAGRARDPPKGPTWNNSATSSKKQQRRMHSRNGKGKLAPWSSQFIQKKPFKCDKCDFSASYSMGLKLHALSHVKEKGCRKTGSSVSPWEPSSAMGQRQNRPHPPSASPPIPRMTTTEPPKFPEDPFLGLFLTRLSQLLT